MDTSRPRRMETPSANSSSHQAVHFRHSYWGPGVPVAHTVPRHTSPSSTLCSTFLETDKGHQLSHLQLSLSQDSPYLTEISSPCPTSMNQSVTSTASKLSLPALSVLIGGLLVSFCCFVVLFLFSLSPTRTGILKTLNMPKKIKKKGKKFAKERNADLA